MIHAIHQEPKQQPWYQYFWCLLNFLILNYVIFFAFASVCFESLLDPPAWPILAAIYTILLVDIILGYLKAKAIHLKKQLRLYLNIYDEKVQRLPSSTYVEERTDFQNLYPLALYNSTQAAAFINSNQRYLPYWIFLNSIVLFVLIMASVLDNLLVSDWPLFLGLASLLRLLQLVKFNQIIKSLIEASRILWMIALIIKIFYVMLIFSHVFACIFYALDRYLIQIEYFGTLNQNPSLYYQGQTAAFTPIYTLSENWRYVYAMYYMVSLLSTDAYGDMIPHNQFENLLVIFYLFMSTIFIAWILQQMVIVFRQNKSQFYSLLRCVKSLTDFLNKYNIPHSEITNYLLEKHYKKDQHQQIFMKLSKKISKSLLRQSNLLNVFPQSLLQYAFYSFSEQFYPQGYTILDNNQKQQQLSFCQRDIISQMKIPLSITIVTNGKIECSFTHNSFSKFESCDKIFGLEEFITGTTNINPYLLARVKNQAIVYTITQKKLRQIVNNIVHCQKFQLQNKKIDQNRITIFNPRKQQKTVFVATTEQDSLKIRQSMQDLKDQFIFHKFKLQLCSCCGETGHIALNCSYCHYVCDVLQIIKKEIVCERRYLRRKRIKSSKIGFKNVSKQLLQSNTNKRFREHSDNSSVTIVDQFIQRFEQRLEQLKKQYFHDQDNSVIEQYFNWQNYETRFNYK